MNQFVFIFGGVNIDIFGFSSQDIIPHDSNPGIVKTDIGGVAKNITENLRRLEVPVKMMTVFGNDSFKAQAQKHLTDLQVDFTTSIESTKTPSSIYLAVIDQSKDMHVAINSMGVLEEITIEHISKYDHIIDQAEIIVLDTNYHQEIIEFIVNKYKHKKIIIDAVSASKVYKLRSCLHNIHTLKCNQLELEKLLDIKINTEQELIDAMKSCLKQGVSHLYVTKGEEGIYYSHNGSIEIFKQTPINPVNTTGAGDAFTSGLIYGAYHQLSKQKTVQISDRLARETLLVLGANNPTITKKLLEDIL